MTVRGEITTTGNWTKGTATNRALSILPERRNGIGSASPEKRDYRNVENWRTRLLGHIPIDKSGSASSL
jgi:hypothetical protein